MIILTKTEREQLRATVFNEVLKKYDKDFGKSIASFWSVARGIGNPLESFADRKYYNLHYKKNWEALETDKETNEVMVEQATWTVYMYEYDCKKEEPFATDEHSKTLLFEDLLISTDDITYPYLSRLMNEEDY